MTKLELIEAAKNYEITPERIDEMIERIKAAEVIFMKQAEERKPTTEWLNRTYTI